MSMKSNVPPITTPFMTVLRLFHQLFSRITKKKERKKKETSKNEKKRSKTNKSTNDLVDLETRKTGELLVMRELVSRVVWRHRLSPPGKLDSRLDSNQTDGNYKKKNSQILRSNKFTKE
jgi:hypothetical protein